MKNRIFLVGLLVGLFLASAIIVIGYFFYLRSCNLKIDPRFAFRHSIFPLNRLMYEIADSGNDSFVSVNVPLDFLESHYYYKSPMFENDLNTTPGLRQNEIRYNFSIDPVKSEVTVLQEIRYYMYDLERTFQTFGASRRPPLVFNYAVDSWSVSSGLILDGPLFSGWEYDEKEEILYYFSFLAFMKSRDALFFFYDKYVWRRSPLPIPFAQRSKLWELFLNGDMKGKMVIFKVNIKELRDRKGEISSHTRELSTRKI